MLLHQQMNCLPHLFSKNPPKRCFLAKAGRKSNASPTSTLLVNNPFLSPTYAKTRGYTLPKNVGAPTFSIFPHTFGTFSQATAECGERSGPPSFLRQGKPFLCQGRRSAGPSRKAEGSWLAGVDDDPVGDGVPEGGFAEGKADLLDEDQGRSGPEGGAVNLAGGP